LGLARDLRRVQHRAVGEGRTGEPGTNQERLTVAQAATRLGITEGAVRSRIKRGTLETTKEGGTVFVLWGGGTSQANQTTNTGVPGDQSELVASLQDQIRYLREQLDAEREARTEERRRHDTVLAQLSAANAEQARTIRALEAPQEASEDAETVEEAHEDELGAERARRETAETTLHEGMAEQRRRREEAEQERDELRRQLYGIRERRESAQKAEEQQGRGQPQPDAPGAQEGAQRRPWWRRVFGR
jgi:hypothetical protein